ncbi:hypothetical protein CL656_05025 [bacterium]|nr:hypothetical protein [bacterium]|tara:strand:- start:4985 stop:5530 length:546 start_codon:yes stop_codon:yes gene_type:complete
MKKDFKLKGINTIIFDFDGIFTDNNVIINQEGIESVICSRADGLAISMLKKYIILKNLNIDIFILSTETNKVVMKRSEKIKLKCYQAIGSKYTFIKNYFSNKKIDLDDGLNSLFYIGNDLNDLEIMSKTKQSACPSDAHKLIKNISKIIIHKNGGNGFVRELVENLISLDQLSYEEIIKII